MSFELIRRWVRGLLGYRSPIYRFISYLISQSIILRREGWRTMFQLEKINGMAEAKIVLNLRGLQYPITVRPRTDDLPSVINNVIREEYGQFDADYTPSVIVDAGAYIGDTSAYFLSRFPAARVIALEPNEESFTLALQNLKPYGDRVSLLQAALWTEVTTVRFGGVQTGAAIGLSGHEVATIDSASLMDKYGFNSIDLLKLDIEGAEYQVIPAGRGNWLEKVGTILLETHGHEIEAELIPLLRDSGFNCEKFRNVWYCRRI